jgi:DNA-binding LacI/PurR family transcriptional regulator
MKNSMKIKGPKTKRTGLYALLLTAIQSGDYEEGDLIPTENELAAKYDVSRSTISRTLQRLKEEGYITRKAGYGTIVRSIDINKNKKIGLMVPGLNNSEIFEPICKTISEYASEFNYSIYWNEKKLSSISQPKADEIDNICQNYINEGVEGILLSPLSRIPNMSEINSHIISKFDEHDIKVVLIDRDIVPWPSRSHLDLVSSDNFFAGYTMAKHLLKSGGRKIAYVLPEHTACPGYQRYIGVLKAIEEQKDYQAELKLITLDLNLENLLDQIEKVIKPDSIICSNDTLAAKIFQACLAKKISVPEDIQLAGFDDVNFARNLGVPLTSFSQPLEEIAFGALKLMKSRLNGESKAPRALYLSGALKVRSSTR